MAWDKETIIAICAAMALSGCAVVEQPTFLMVNFTDAGLNVTHDEKVALEWARSDEMLVIDTVRLQRLEQDGSRSKIQ